MIRCYTPYRGLLRDYSNSNFALPIKMLETIIISTIIVKIITYFLTITEIYLDDKVLEGQVKVHSSLLLGQIGIS